MAKRRRLDILPDASPAPAKDDTMIEDIPTGWVGPRIGRRSTAPIAEVARDAAREAAFEEVAGELAAARSEGRLVRRLPLEAIETGHLVRDRMALDPEEMEVLQRSLETRGQQVPVEVVALAGGRFGLISGWRRVEALRRNGQAEVLALVREPQGADAAYVAMIEENEVRASLSYYERARLAAEAARIGVFADPEVAVRTLFASVPAPRRWKIARFLVLHDRIGAQLRFPAAIPEKLGLALAQAIEADAGLVVRLKDLLRKAEAESAEAERAILERALRRSDPAAGPARDEVRPGLFLETRKGRAVLSGKALDADLLADLRDWLATRG